MIISVGIPTVGLPMIERQGDFTLLKNMLIGKDFHWESSIEALLPGEVVAFDDTVFRLINRVPLEQYLQCVAGSEMNPEAPEEFLKAHAVISRSWALGKVLHLHNDSGSGKIHEPDCIVDWEDTCDHRGFDVCSDDHCQRYQGLQPIPERVLQALQSTEGEVLLTDGGKLVDARFSKCCGGRTELFSSCWQSREEACLKSVEDPWCGLAARNVESGEQGRNILRRILKEYDLANSGGYRWNTEVTAEEVRKNLRDKFGIGAGRVTGLEVTRRGASGRAVEITVSTDRGRIRIGKELMIRRLLAPTHLYSSWIEIIPVADNRDISDLKWRIEGRGWGHGVGLCQIGAARMAMDGYDYRSILQFYYHGASVGRWS